MNQMTLTLPADTVRFLAGLAHRHRAALVDVAGRMSEQPGPATAAALTHIDLLDRALAAGGAS